VVSSSLAQPVYQEFASLRPATAVRRSHSTYYYYYFYSLDTERCYCFQCVCMSVCLCVSMCNKPISGSGDMSCSIDAVDHHISGYHFLVKVV